MGMLQAKMNMGKKVNKDVQRCPSLLEVFGKIVEFSMLHGYTTKPRIRKWLSGFRVDRKTANGILLRLSRMGFILLKNERIYPAYIFSEGRGDEDEGRKS